MGKTALILGDDSEGLQRIYGLPAVRRVVLMTSRLGFDKIHLIGRDPRLYEAVSDLIGADAFHHLENGSHAESVIKKLRFDDDESVLIIKAGHVIDRWSLERLLEAGQNERTALLGRGEGERDGVIFLVKAPELLPLVASLETPSGTDARNEMGAVQVDAGPGLPEVLTGQAESVRNAEAGLAAAVARATWHRDSLLSRYLNRPISQLMSPSIARTGITANVVTLLNTIIGLAGAYLVFRGGYLSQIAGSLLFLISTIVDGIDGEVARLKLQETDSGRALDIACDNTVHVALFSSIGVALYRETGDGRFLYVLLALLVGFGLCALLINRVLTEGLATPQPTRLAVLLEMLFNNRDFAYVVVGFALFHHLDWFLMASAAGIYVLTGTLWAAKAASRLGRHTMNAGK